MQFPDPWLNLITSYSDLGERASQVIAGIEAMVERREANGACVYPHKSVRYQALANTDPKDCLAILAGQDPYHGDITLPDGSIAPEACGLAFSVPRGAKIPPSLRNIYAELQSDLGILPPTHGDLRAWSRNVLLLNSVLTVEKDSPKSHDKLGWQKLTAAIIQAISRSCHGRVFLLWGNSAQRLRRFVDESQHTVIASSHPSPLFGSAHKGFFGSKPFSQNKPSS